MAIQLCPVDTANVHPRNILGSSSSFDRERLSPFGSLSSRCWETVVYITLSSGPAQPGGQPCQNGDAFQHSQNSARRSITPLCQNRGPAKDERKTPRMRPRVSSQQRRRQQPQHAAPGAGRLRAGLRGCGQKLWGYWARMRRCSSMVSMRTFATQTVVLSTMCSRRTGAGHERRIGCA